MLSVLLVDPSSERRERLARHLSQRFAVRAFPATDGALEWFRQQEPAAVVSAYRLNRGSGLQLCASFRSMSRCCALLVHGAARRPLSAQMRAVVDICVPEFLQPETIEALIWDSIVRRHTDSDAQIRTEKRERWLDLVAQEPMLGKVRSVLKAHRRSAPLQIASQLQVLLHTGHSSSSPAQHAPFVAIAEPDRDQRRELVEHFAGRLRLLFVAHPADLPELLRRQPVSAVIIHGSGADEALIEMIRATHPRAFPVLVHGFSAPLPVERQVYNNVYPALLEVLLWEEIVRGDPSLLRAVPAAAPAPAPIRSANRSDAEVAARSSWGELLNAEANMTNLRRLLSKEIQLSKATELTQPDALRERSWRELLQAEVTPETLHELLTREIHLFPKRGER